VNAEQIRNMEAGREMDARVAEEVMGWEWMRQEPGHKYGGGSILTKEKCKAHLIQPDYKWIEWCELIPDDGQYPRGMNHSIPHYSTDIAAAWEVVEKLDRGPVVIRVTAGPETIVQFIGYGGGASGPTAPLAICRAALHAVMGDES